MDLPSRFTRVIGKVCTQLLVRVHPEEECITMFLGLIDKCLSHEAFNPMHAKRLVTWKQQVLTICQPLPPKAKDARHLRRWSQQYGSETLGGSFRSSRMNQYRYSTSGSNSQVAGLLVAASKSLHGQHPAFFSMNPATGNIGTLVAARNSSSCIPSLAVTSLLSPQQFLAKRPSLQEASSEVLFHIKLIHF